MSRNRGFDWVNDPVNSCLWFTAPFHCGAILAARVIVDSLRLSFPSTFFFYQSYYDLVTMLGMKGLRFSIESSFFFSVLFILSMASCTLLVISMVWHKDLSNFDFILFDWLSTNWARFSVISSFSWTRLTRDCLLRRLSFDLSMRSKYELVLRRVSLPLLTSLISLRS